MGTNNRERRRAKERARQEQQRRRQDRIREQQGSPFGRASFGDTGHDAPVFGGSPSGVPGSGPSGPHRRTEQIALVGQVARSAVIAMDAGDQATVDQHVDLLAHGDGRLGGQRSVDLALLTILQRNVSDLWRRGWQPADLIRMVRRQCATRQVQITVVLVAAEMRQYAQNTVDEQWAAQLRDLGAEPSGVDDADLVDTIAGDHRITRWEVIGHLLQILRVLTTCPKIEMLCPPPGTARTGSLGADQRPAGQRPNPLQAADPRQLDRVRALLAKAESTEFPDEAEAYTAKAQQLMARYSIDTALLAATGGGCDEPGGRRIGVDNPYEAPKVLLLDAVAKANRCRTVWAKPFGYVTVLGFPADLDAVELLFTSLLVQATAAMNSAGTRTDAYGRSSTRSFRQSFLTAYAQRIGERLTAATNQATEQAEQDLAGREDLAGRQDADRLLPVLASRVDAVHAKVDELFPKLSAQSVSVTNREGWVSGRAAADRARLGTAKAVGSG